MANRQVQIRRDTAANLAAATPASGELGFATDTKKFVVGDGSTAGGVPLAKESQPDLVLKQGSSPAPTAEGAIQWDTDDERIVVGDGSGQKLFSNDDALMSMIGQIVGMVNGTIVASVAANALTVAIKTLAGNDPSATDPVHIFFRNATAATGNYVKRSLIAATSTVISSGSTLGAANNTAFRLRLVAFDDGGTVRLGLVNTVSGTTIMALRDDMLLSSTAEGGAGAADSAQVIYTGTAVTTKAQKMLGYLDWSSGLSTVGTWASGPTKIQLQNPGVPRPGDLVQTARTETGSMATGTGTVPLDNTIPQNTEGDQWMSLAVTPTAAPNLLHVTALLNFGCSASAVAETVSLFQDSNANALASAWDFIASAHAITQVALLKRLLAATSSSTTFKARSGTNTAGTTTFNGVNGGATYGGVFTSYMQVDELAA